MIEQAAKQLGVKPATLYPDYVPKSRDEGFEKLIERSMKSRMAEREAKRLGVEPATLYPDYVPKHRDEGFEKLIKRSMKSRMAKRKAKRLNIGNYEQIAPSDKQSLDTSSPKVALFEEIPRQEPNTSLGEEKPCGSIPIVDEHLPGNLDQLSSHEFDPSLADGPHRRTISSAELPSVPSHNQGSIQHEAHSNSPYPQNSQQWISASIIKTTELGSLEKLSTSDYRISSQVQCILFHWFQNLAVSSQSSPAYSSTGQHPSTPANRQHEAYSNSSLSHNSQQWISASSSATAALRPQLPRDNMSKSSTSDYREPALELPEAKISEVEFWAKITEIRPQPCWNVIQQLFVKIFPDQRSIKQPALQMRKKRWTERLQKASVATQTSTTPLWPISYTCPMPSAISPVQTTAMHTFAQRSILLAAARSMRPE